MSTSEAGAAPLVESVRYRVFCGHARACANPVVWCDTFTTPGMLAFSCAEHATAWLGEVAG